MNGVDITEVSIEGPPMAGQDLGCGAIASDLQQAKEDVCGDLSSSTARLGCKAGLDEVQADVRDFCGLGDDAGGGVYQNGDAPDAGQQETASMSAAPAGAGPSPREVEEFVADQLGGREPDVDCQEAIEEGWNVDTCLNPRGTAQLIACLANRAGAGATTKSEAWRQAWQDAESQCDRRGQKIRDLLVQ